MIRGLGFGSFTFVLLTDERQGGNLFCGDEVMTITIESQQEAKDLASALLTYTKESLRRAGCLVQQVDEDHYYAEERHLICCLERYCGKGIR